MIKGSVIQETDGIGHYVSKLYEYWQSSGRTTEQQVDTLIILYRITNRDNVFKLILILHKSLLLSLVDRYYYKYEAVLIPEDKADITSMVYYEFYRRVLYYKIPPEAPFPRYVKLWFKLWINVYTKGIGDKNKKHLLVGDRDDVVRYCIERSLFDGVVDEL